MGLFNRRSGNMPSQWIILNDIEQLDGIVKASHDKPQIIFKDSTSCGISARAKAGLQEDWTPLADHADLHYLDLLSHRNISNEVATFTGVIHQSPQVIVYHNGKVVADTSHHNISVRYLKGVLDKLS